MIMKRRIDSSDLNSMFLRCFLVQGSWNYKSMLGIGFCYTMLPVLKKIFKTEEERQQFIKRHLQFFNAHPYFASWCAGAVAKLEEEAIREKWDDYRPIAIFKERLIGPLGAIGDKLFWDGIKPAAAGLGVWVAIEIGWIALPIFLIAYNIPHFYIRLKGIRDGYKSGFDIVSVLSMRRFQKWLNVVSWSGALIAGLCLTAGTELAWKTDVKYIPIFLLSVIITMLLLFFKKSINLIFILIVLMAVGLSYFLS